MPHNSSGVRNKELLRRHALAAGIMAAGASLIILEVSLPFSRHLAALSAFGAVCYFIYYAMFRFLERTCLGGVTVVLSQIGVVIVTAAVYFTGGLVSPFIFLYFSMLVAEALYGLQNPYTMPASLVGYLLVVSGNYFGFLPIAVPWAHAIYRAPIAVLLTAGLTASYLALTNRMTAKILFAMRARLDSEAVEKEALLRRFSELNSTTQLGVLAHRIAHDLRGPIASFSGFLELRLAQETDPVERETINGVQETVNSLVQSLQNITRFGKPGGPTRENIVLCDFIKDLIGIASFAPQTRGITFETDCGGNERVSVVASRSDLQQALFNVIKNAVEAVAGNSGSRRIRITVGHEGGSLAVSISDNGPGMPEELLKEAFRKSVTTKKDGTGVGLLITRDLLIRNGGDIRLATGKDGGFTATVLLEELPGQASER